MHCLHSWMVKARCVDRLFTCGGRVFDLYRAHWTPSVHVVLCVDTHGRGSPLCFMLVMTWLSLWWPHAIMNKWFINLCWMDVVSICYMYVLCVCPSRFALCLVSGSLPFSNYCLFGVHIFVV